MKGIVFMKNLVEKYGDEFDWGEVEVNSTTFEKEAYNEICSTHPYMVLN